MTTHIVKGYAFMERSLSLESYEYEWKPDVWSVKMDESADRILLREMDIAVEVPDDFDPVPKQIAALEAEKIKALADYQKTVASLNQQLSQLQAITYAPT